MIDIDLHRAHLITILREIYSDSLLRTLLGFKGGTAALLFYALPRFSIDLDFDLLNPDKKDSVFERLQVILAKEGNLKQALEKRNTLFFLLNYQKDERNLKVEVSKRPSKSTFFSKNYLGISMLVMRKEDMVAGKLAALLTRNRFAARDLFDLWFFLKNDLHMNEELVHDKTGMSLTEALKVAQNKVKEVKKTDLLAGMGDLLDIKQKVWVKEKLQHELLFLLQLYASTHENHPRKADD